MKSLGRGEDKRKEERERACLQYHDTHLKLCYVHQFHLYLHSCFPFLAVNMV